MSRNANKIKTILCILVASLFVFTSFNTSLAQEKTSKQKYSIIKQRLKEKRELEKKKKTEARAKKKKLIELKRQKQRSPIKEAEYTVLGTLLRRTLWKLAKIYIRYSSCLDTPVLNQQQDICG